MSLLLKDEKKSKYGLRFEELVVKGYEKVYKVTSREAGLTAVISLHDLRLGPGLGGCRIYPYATFDQALEDVLRLSKGMTYKSAVSQCGWGGAKSVIMADPKKEKTETLLRAFGEAVHLLGGLYIAAEDVGCSPQDLIVMNKETHFLVGLPQQKSSGNPSPFTAWGVYRGIQASLKEVFGSDSVAGKKIAIQGTGSVGSALADFLFWQGAQLIICDVDTQRAAEVAKRYDAQQVSVDEIYGVECDVFAPCALGAIINETTVPQLRCKIVAGAANNPLLTEADGEALKQRGILYAPDFLINSGGLINVNEELEKEGYSPSSVLSKINLIYEQLAFIYRIAKQNGITTHQAAVDLGIYNLRYGVGKKSGPIHFHHSNAILNRLPS